MKRSKRLAASAALGLGLVAPSSLLAVSLPEAITQAIRTNPEVLIQTTERKAREQELQQARSGYHPSVDLNAGIGYERSRNTTTRALGGDGDEDLTRKELGLNLRQMVFDGWATKSEVLRQQARVNSAAYSVQGTTEQIALRGSEVYLAVLRRQELLDLAEENLAAHERIYEQISARTEARVGRGADLDQIEARRALAESNLFASRNNLLDAQTNYLAVIGDLPADLERPDGVQGVLPSSLDGAVGTSLASNPTLKSAGSDVAAAMAQHRAARNTYFPRFDIELGRNWNDDLDGQAGVNHDGLAMLRMRYNLYRGGGDVARRKQTAQLINEAKEVRNRTCRQVVESTRLSWTAYEVVGRQLPFLEQHVRSAEATRTAYQEQFGIGQRTLLDMLDSENELFVASQAFVEGQYDRLFAEYRILSVMGNLIDYLGVAQPDESRVDPGTEVPMESCEARPLLASSVASDDVRPAFPGGKRTSVLDRWSDRTGDALTDAQIASTAIVVPAAARSASIAAATQPVLQPVDSSPPPVEFGSVSPEVVAYAAKSGGEGNSATESEVRSALYAWLDAWSAQDVDQYISFYHDNFVPPRGQSRIDWESARRHRVVAPQYVRVNIADPQIEIRGNEQARVTLVQNYQSDSYRDEVKKQIRLVRTGAGWKITRESTLR